MDQEDAGRAATADIISHSPHVIAKEEPLDVGDLPKQLKIHMASTVNAQDYDDPQAGPSGIKQEMHPNDRSAAEYQQNRCYTNAVSSSDDGSDEDNEIMQTTTLWRSRGTFNLNQTSRPNLNNRDLDDDSLHNQTTTAAPAAVATGGVSGGLGASGANSNNIDSGMEILTAPDLQLDWLSDSSDQSIDEVVCVPLPSSPPAVDEANVKAESDTIAAVNEPSLQIDLTTSDDEDVMEINVYNDADAHMTRVPTAPVQINCLRHALYDGYHNRESHVGHLNCRSAYSTCDCLEATR